MHPAFRTALAGVSALLLALPAQAQPAGKPGFPLLNLPAAKLHGQPALDQLGHRLPDVAAWYGKTPEEFRAWLLHDRLIKIDRRGRVFVEDEITTPLPAPLPQDVLNSQLTGALLPLDQTFLLHSRPGAKRTIYLNFKGGSIAGSAWSSTALNALPFDMDGIPYSFSTAELQRIQGIWQRVVEDYAPFDVDVTTEAPPADRITRSSSADDIYGTTVFITSRSGVYSCSCGGVAYLGVFDDTSDFYKPALVFWDALGAGEKNVAEAISHEAGHNMGLAHDGSATAGYYSGHGSGATGWAPIMGVGYYQALVQWSRGEYAGANNVQDDVAVMQSNGLPLRADDRGGTPGTATAMNRSDSGGISSYSATGVIERPGDVDMYAFVAGAGTVSVTLSPAARAANLDARLTLHDGAGTLLASANPLDALNATLSFVLPTAGTYHVAVTGTGKGDPLTTGYTHYGSLGQYALALSAYTPTGLAPVAVLAAAPTSGTVPLSVAFSAAGSNDPDGSVASVAWTFGDGSTANGASVNHVYTSAGSFTAELRVTDDSGMSAVKSVTITAQPPVLAQTMSVANIAMSLSTQRNGQTRATAVVTVRDSQGLALPGATVSGSWSGLVTGSASVISGSSGNANFISGTSRRSGSFVFTVTGISLPGYSYNPALNTETRDAISR